MIYNHHTKYYPRIYVNLYIHPFKILANCIVYMKILQQLNFHHLFLCKFLINTMIHSLGLFSFPILFFLHYQFLSNTIFLSWFQDCNNPIPIYRSHQIIPVICHGYQCHIIIHIGVAIILCPFLVAEAVGFYDHGIMAVVVTRFPKIATN